MEDLKKIQEFFSKPLNENKVTKEDFDKVVKILSKSKYPFTIMLVPKWDEIDIITGQDSPDEISDDISQRLDSAGLNWGGNSGITISGDSSNYSRREYSDIFKVNGGHKDYYEESYASSFGGFRKELDGETIENELQAKGYDTPNTGIWNRILVTKDGKRVGMINTDESSYIKDGKIYKWKGISNFINHVESVNEMDINDPILMKMRAAKDKLAKMRAANAGDDGNDKFFDNAKKIAFLKKERERLMRDMEQEAEPEGGPIADEYGSKLNRIDKAIAKLSGRKEMTYDQAIAENDSYARVSMPRFVKDKNNPNFLNVYIDYDIGPGGASIAFGKETMTGQIRRLSAAKAMRLAGDVARDLEAEYNLEDIEITDLENGKVRIFAVSDDFINMDPNMLSEATKKVIKEMTYDQAIAEMKVGDKVTFKSGGDDMEIIGVRDMFASDLKAYRVKNADGETFEYSEDQLQLAEGLSPKDFPVNFTYGGTTYVFNKIAKDRAVYYNPRMDGDTASFGSREEMDSFLDDYTSPGLNEYDVYMPSQEEVDKFFALTNNETHYLNSKPVMGQEGTFNLMPIEPWDEYDLSNWNSLVRKAKAKGKSVSEGFFDRFKSKSNPKNATDKVKDPKGVKTDKKVEVQGKNIELWVDQKNKPYINYEGKFIYVQSPGLEVKYADYKQPEPSTDSKEKTDAPTTFTWSGDDLKSTSKPIGPEYELTGKFYTYKDKSYPVNIDKKTKREYFQHEDGRVLDIQSVEKNTFKPFKKKVSETLAETIKLGEGVIEEELCPKGKAYIKRRKAAGEKSSAYLSGRAVKVCKGQMSGRKKKK